MVALKIPNVAPPNPATVTVMLERATAELWSNELSTSTTSPILAGDSIYVVGEKGDLCAVDANTGKIQWKLKVGIEQRNACPLFADAKLYVPMLDDPDAKSEGGETGSKGAFYVIKPGAKAGEILSHVTLDGRCFGTPVAYNGKVYLQTTRHLYCFGKQGNNPDLPPEPPPEPWPSPGAATQLQITPSEVLLRPRQAVAFRVRKLDANGFTVEEVKDMELLKWTPYIPPTARVRSNLKGSFTADAQLVPAHEPTPSAGAFEATLDGLKGDSQRRVLPGLPLKQDFD